jgi:hydrogenase nickel incorporation protein HypB
VVFSVTEGEDKPLKYPGILRKASVAVLNKVDLLPHLDFDPERAIAYARQINPGLRFFRTSARTGQGLVEWFDFLRSQVVPASVW